MERQLTLDVGDSIVGLVGHGVTLPRVDPAIASLSTAPVMAELIPAQAPHPLTIRSPPENSA